MSQRRIIKQLIASLLILVFSQKMGMGLYLHNWLHHSVATASLSNEELKNACTCINDFTAPLEETAVQQIPIPLSTTLVPAATQVTGLPVVYKYFRSLRAPPSPLI